MPRIAWDKVGEHFYEAGLDRGVLYLSTGETIPWNGLVSIEEDFGEDSVNPNYFDGVKIRDNQAIGDFSAKLTAFTYPDEFLGIEGITELHTGMYADGQRPQRFGMSYRTLVGNDLVGEDYGYKIHLLYNLIATRDSNTYESLSQSFDPTLFSWSLGSIPGDTPNYRPTSHIILDSRKLNQAVLLAIEDALYGKDDPSAAPYLPTISQIFDFVMMWDPRLIVPAAQTGLSPLLNGYGDITQTNIDGIYAPLPPTKLQATTPDGFYIVDPLFVHPNPSTTFWFDFDGGTAGTRVLASHSFGTPFSSVSWVSEYSAPGKNSENGVVVGASEANGYALLRWDNSSLVDMASMGCWLRPSAYPGADERIFDLRSDSDGKVGGLVYAASTQRFHIMDEGPSAWLSQGQSPVLLLDRWYWITLSYNVSAKIARLQIFDVNGLALHDSGNVPITATMYNSIRAIRFYTRQYFMDMLQFNPGSDNLLPPWMY